MEIGCQAGRCNITLRSVAATQTWSGCGHNARRPRWQCTSRLKPDSRLLHLQGRQLTLRSAVVFHGERSGQGHYTALVLRGKEWVCYDGLGRRPVADGWHGVREQVATRGVLLCYAD